MNNFLRLPFMIFTSSGNIRRNQSLPSRGCFSNPVWKSWITGATSFKKSRRQIPIWNYFTIENRLQQVSCKAFLPTLNFSPAVLRWQIIRFRRHLNNKLYQALYQFLFQCERWGNRRLHVRYGLRNFKLFDVFENEYEFQERRINYML